MPEIVADVHRLRFAARFTMRTVLQCVLNARQDVYGTCELNYILHAISRWFECPSQDAESVQNSVEVQDHLRKTLRTPLFLAHPIFKSFRTRHHVPVCLEKA